MAKNFDDDDDNLQNIPPELRKEIKAKREKQKTLLIALVLIGMLIYGVWNDHFRDKGGAEVAPIPQEDWTYTQTQTNVTPQDESDKALEDSADKFIEENGILEFFEKSFNWGK